MRTKFAPFIIVATGLSLLAAVSLRAGTITVTSNSDSGAGSLRELLASAGNGDTVDFSVGSPITLTSGQIIITQNVTIDASALASGVIISGNTNSRIFQIESTATVTLKSLALISGAVSNASGGAILNLGNLTAINCRFTNNVNRGGAGQTPGVNSNGGAGGGGAGMGGAIFSEGAQLFLTNCVFSANRAIGGNGGNGLENSFASDPGGNGGGPNGGTGGAVGNAGGAGMYGGGGGGGAGSFTSGSFAGGAGGFGGGGGGGGARGAGGDGGAGGQGGSYGGHGGYAAYSSSGGGGGGAGLGGAIFVKTGSVSIASCTFSANLATNGFGGGSYYGVGPGLGVGGAIFCPGINARLVANQFSNNAASSLASDVWREGFVQTLPAGVWAPTAATLKGQVNPGGLETIAWFEWGTTTNYGNSTPVTNVGNSATSLSVSRDLTGLIPGGTYHYRVAASNSFGLARGFDEVLTTPVSFFTTLSVSGLPGVGYGSGAWADYDNDERLDFLVTGSLEPSGSGQISQVWRNTGASFTNINAGLSNVYWSATAWGDYDNDERVDFLLTGDMSPGRIAQVWRNTTTGFSNVTAAVAPGLEGIYYGSVAWGDYDNDGDLDLLLTGTGITSGRISQIWRNTGTGFVNVTATVAPGLQGVGSSAVAWGDYDNDGRLDFLLTGAAYSGRIAQVWRNTGTGFTNVPIPGLAGVNYGAVAWADYDNDGRLDFLLAGADRSEVDGTPDHAITQVWRNTGTGFTNVPIPGLSGVAYGALAWGDYDNDGRLDFVVTGNTFSGIIAELWRNTESGFTRVNVGLPVAYGSSVAWGDYNNDGRLDLLLTGRSSGGRISQVWRNNAPVANMPPTAPSGLTAVVAGREATLAWRAATDGQTPADGLTYNLRVGTTTTGADVVSPQAALATGFRRLPALGNAQYGLSAVADLPWGIYFWSVQALDTAFAGSMFAGEEHFVIATETLPPSEVGLTTATLNATVHPLAAPTVAWFEWGATELYGNSTAMTDLGSGNSPLPVSCVLTGLVLHGYHYRVVATNVLGVHLGNDKVIHLQLEPPQVLTEPANTLAAPDVILRASVNPRERETHVWFEYGLTTKYGSTTPPFSIGGGSSSIETNYTLSNLLPWMTYHYRALASNSVGLSLGDDLTVAAPEPAAGTLSLSPLSNVTLPQGGSTQVWFTALPAGVNVRARCSNPVLLPPSGVVLGGSGNDRSLMLVPAVEHSGSAQMTVTASDGTRATTSSFILTVMPRDTTASRLLYLADVHPVAGEAWRFRIFDYGTASTNYTVEYRADLSPTNQWAAATNVTAVGDGVFEVNTGPPQRDAGFYRVRGMRWLTAGLNATAAIVDEGAAGGMVIVFNGVYTGTVSYTWGGTQGTNTGTLQVNGTTAVIPIPPSFVTDNAGIDPLRYLTLRLEDGPGFALSGTTESSLTVTENDADWQGILLTTNGTVNFVLTLQQTNDCLYGQLKSDGFTFFPATILTQLRFTENAFTAVATNISLPALPGSPVLGTSNYIDLRLDAANISGQTNVTPTQISGVATLVSVVPGRPYLDTAISGPFLLLRPPVIPSTNNVPLVPAQ